jgi:3-methyladenine DNA glycosylase AlkD
MKKKRSPSAHLRKLGNPTQARNLSRFFKTGPGEYGEGDRFVGVTVPQIRQLARVYRDLTREEHAALLESPIHEERMLALILWTEQIKKSDPAEQRKLARLYLRNWKSINNWDLVDVSAPIVVGPALFAADAQVLRTLRAFIRSKNLWQRRIAILSTFYLIRRNEFELLREFTETVLQDDEDLIHKASGWMLREAGKRDLSVLRGFLKNHAGIMPRTMLRYSIEKLSKAERLKWMKTATLP